MPHPLVDQLKFTRSELRRGLRGTPYADGLTRIGPMNSIGWIVGHLAWQEQRYWLTRAQGETPIPLLNDLVANGGPATTPSLLEMEAALRLVTTSAEPWLNGLTSDALKSDLAGSGPSRTVGDALQRVIYHYWFHLGEVLAIRQLLGHQALPEFVGAIEDGPHTEATEERRALGGRLGRGLGRGRVAMRRPATTWRLAWPRPWPLPP